MYCTLIRTVQYRRAPRERFAKNNGSGWVGRASTIEVGIPCSSAPWCCNERRCNLQQRAPAVPPVLSLQGL